MSVRNNDFTNIYRDAVALFAAKGVALLAREVRRSSSVSPEFQRELEAMLAELDEAAQWGSRPGQPPHAAEIRRAWAKGN